MHQTRPLAFIHLSDIHFTRGTSNTTYDLDEDIRTEIANDIRRLKEGIDHFDGVLITGDIAFAGQKEEYDTAEQWLSEISTLIDCKPEEVWMVPGNHDVDRSAETDALVKLVRQTLRDTSDDKIDGKFKEFVHDQSTSAECVFKPLAAYCEFAAKYKCSSTPLSLQWSWDFLLNDGSTLKLVGLNSAILSHTHDSTGDNKLTLNLHQLAPLKNEAGVEYITLCHHPMDWIRNKDVIEQKIKSRVRVQLYGHKHNHVCDIINNRTVYLVAGAAHPSRAEKNWVPRYNALSVFVETSSDSKRRLCIKIYPRVWHENSHCFTADQQHCDQGQEYKHVIFDLEAWQPSIAEAETPPAENVAPDIPSEEAMDSSQDIRKLTYNYLTLSYSKQMKIANELELLAEEDAGVEKSELFKRIVARAKEQKVLQQLSKKIENIKASN